LTSAYRPRSLDQENGSPQAIARDCSKTRRRFPQIETVPSFGDWLERISSTERHIYERGPHGVGLAPADAALSTWTARLADWLRVRGLLKAAAE
jgi:hypothetical protein